MKLEDMRALLATPEEPREPRDPYAPRRSIGYDAAGADLFADDTVSWFGLHGVQKAVLLAEVHDGRMALIRTDNDTRIRVVPWPSLVSASATDSERGG